MADKRQACKELRDVRVALLKIKEDRQKGREGRNADIGRISVGNRVVVGDKVLVKEAESVMAREGVHRKLSHEYWTGPWKVTEVVLPGLSYIVTMNARGIHRRRASVAKIRTTSVTISKMNLLTWHGELTSDLRSRLVASPMYTLIDIKALMGQSSA